MQNMYTFCKKNAQKMQILFLTYLTFIFSFESSIVTQNKLKKNQTMEKKKKSLESLKKFQVKNEGKKDLTGGQVGPTWTPPSWAPTSQICHGNCGLNIYPDGHSESTGNSISFDWD